MFVAGHSHSLLGKNMQPVCHNFATSLPVLLTSGAFTPTMMSHVTCEIECFAAMSFQVEDLMLVMRKAQLRPDVALLVAYAETLEAG